MGCRSRIWDAEVGWRHRTRDGPAPEHHGAGPAAHGDLVAPPGMGSACKEPGNANFQGKKSRLSNRVQGLMPLVPHLGGRAWPRGHICLPDVPGQRFGEGNRAPADGEASSLRWPVWECRSPTSHLLRRSRDRAGKMGWMGPSRPCQ